MPLFYALLIGYSLGNIQMSFILGQWVRKIDIREEGTGNAGASNIVVVMGWKYGFLTFCVDMFKATAAFFITSSLYPLEPNLAFYSGIAAIFGHIFPVFMKFKGGKGIASLLGVILALNPLFFLVVSGSTILGLFVLNYMTLASMIPLLIFPYAAWSFGFSQEVVFAAAGTSLYCVYIHRKNFLRILKKEEPTFRPYAKKLFRKSKSINE